MKNRDNDKRYNRDLTGISTILNKFVKDFGIDKRLKERVLINIWPEIIGDTFADCTKAVSVIKKNGYDVLLVGVSSPTVSQELYFFKKDLIKKISSITNMFEFNIQDIVFSQKVWKEEKRPEQLNTNSDDYVYIFKKNPTEKELSAISVPDSILSDIKGSIETQNFTDDSQKNRLYETIIKDIKIQIWKKNNGFPCCENCGVPLNMYLPTEKNLCPSCKYTKA